MAKFSTKYRVLHQIVKASGFKKKFQKPADEMLKMAKKQTEKVKIPTLSHPELNITIENFDGEKVVYMRHKSKSERACLFIIGGGMIKYPRVPAIKKAMKIALQTGRDMIIPYYPLCIDNIITRPYDFVYKLYQDMLITYSAENIIVTGSSSGANLAIGLSANINAKNEGVPQPGKIYASSPGECFKNDEIKQYSHQLNEKDIIIDAAYMESATWIMTKGKEVPSYMLYLEDGDYTGLKEVYLCYGSDEVLFAAYEPIKNRLEQCGVKVISEIGEGMYHCYPFFPLVKEAQVGWDKMIEYHR